MEPLTTIVGLAPWAEPAVGALRAAHDLHAALGVPAHVTLLGPFLAPRRVTADVVAQVRSLLTACEPVPVVLDVVATFGRAVWLLPRDPAPLVALTERLRAEWPAAPAPSSRHHVTVVHDADEATRARAEAALRARLPLAGVLSQATMLELQPGQPVRTVASFGLGSA